jgi:hypothetical protein
MIPAPHFDHALTVGGVQAVSTFVRRELGFDMLDVDTGTTVVVIGQMLLAFKELSTGSVAAGVADLHLGAVFARSEGGLIMS